MSTFTSSTCLICRDNSQRDSELVTVTAKGADSLLLYSRLHCDNELIEYLESKPVTVNVHTVCRKQFKSKCRFEQQIKTGTDEPVANVDTASKSTMLFNYV